MEDAVGTGLTAQRLAAALDELGVQFVREGDGKPGSPDAFLVTMPGERRHRTLVWLVVGTHDLMIESFVCRKPDENAEGVYRYLLQRNASLRTVGYALDAVGDIHLVGRLGRSAIGADRVTAEIDTLLGTVLAASDADFNPILERGFASAIRREWAWRHARGESAKNLEAFRHLIDADG
jgi:hypothetical protein